MLDYSKDARMVKYAELIMRVGLGFKEGMKISIKTEPSNYTKALLVAKAAYSMGAAFVQIDIDDLDLLSHRLRVQSERELKFYPDFMDIYDKQVVDESWGILTIQNTESQLEVEDVEKLDSYSRTKKRYMFTISQAKNAMSLPWCIVCMPGEKWAEKVFGKPGCEEALWDAMSKCLYLNENEPVKRWESLNEELSTKASLLDSLKIRDLRFRSARSDLKMAVSDKVLWRTGRKQLSDGRYFMPNLPSFEIYTSPICNTIEGCVSITRPFNLPVGVVDGGEFIFKSGKLAEYKCSGVRAAMDAFLASDAHAYYVGEVAFVDKSSPIYDSGIVFSQTLWDENASAHIALGSSHPDCINPLFLDADKQKKAAGFNQSLVHIDCMIGDDDMDVFATTYGGDSVEIIRNGNFVI